MQKGITLVFVYNSDKSSLSGMSDYQHSTKSAKTRPCNLFTLISSPVGMKKTWKRFISELSVPSRFLHRDEFFQLCGQQQHIVPAIYIQSGNSFHELVSTDELSRIDSTDVLIGLVTKRLTQYLK